MEHEFTLRFRLARDDADLDAIVERLGVAGCADALVGMGRAGHLTLEFTREAKDARTARLRALAEVARALPTARLVEG